MKATTLNSKQDPTWALGISMIHEDRASISAASVDGAGPMITVTTEGEKVQIAVGPGIHVTTATVTRDDNTEEGFTVLNPHVPTCVWSDETF